MKFNSSTRVPFMKDLTAVQQGAVVLAVAAKFDGRPGPKPPHAAFVDVARRLGHNTRTVRRVWKAHGHRAADPSLLIHLGARLKGKCGRKTIDAAVV